MDTPICDFVKSYANSASLRLHMPGHKGKSFVGAEALDITEIEGADVLYSAEGIIKQSEENAAKLFGTARTFYSAEGSSLSIRAMLYLAMLQARALNKRPIIAAGRNAHKVFITAAALLDMDISWIFPKNSGTVISCEITPERLEEHFAEMAEKPVAVYITSPDYLGNLADIDGLSRVCRRHGVLLLVDNAHGAYLKFLPHDIHPITLGADICCDSAHKTLPVLTGGAYLHISKNAPKCFCERAEDAMALFASTSPSYLILQSLDMANKYISNGYSERLAEYTKKLGSLKGKLAKMGYVLSGCEPLKITVSAKPYGYSGSELAELLCKSGIVCEFSDPDFTVLMLTPENGYEAIEKIEKAFGAVKRKAEIRSDIPSLGIPKIRLAPRQALFSPWEERCTAECIGKVLASASVSCPPAIPIVACGEEIDEAAVKLLLYYGINKCKVVL